MSPGLELRVVPVDPDDPLCGFGDHLLHLEEEIRGHDLKSLNARWRSGGTINRLKVQTRSRVNTDGVRRMLPQKTRAAVLDLTGASKSEVQARMKLAERYQVTDLSNLLGKYGTWYGICRDALYEKRPTPNPTTPKRSVSPVSRSARDFTIQLRAAKTLTPPERRSLRALAATIAELLAARS